MAPISLPELRTAWGRVQAQQQMMVAGGLRPACRLRVKRNALPLMAETADRLSVKMVIGHDSITIREVAGRGGFSEWGRREGLTPQTRGYCYVYLCGASVYGQRLRRSDEAGDDTAVGSLLGYPDCCVKAFGEHCNNTTGDPVIAAYADDRVIDWRMNVSLVCFGYSLLSHVPCAPDCSSSRVLAAEYFNFLKALDPNEAEELEQLLSGSVLHTDLLGVLSFEGLEHHGELKVEKLLAVHEDSILRQLVAPGSVVRREHSGVSVDGSLISGSQVRLFHFN